MLTRMRILLGISDKEWPRVISVASMLFIFTAGIEFGRIGRDSYFLTEVGADKLPYTYMFIAVLMLIISGVYGIIVDRIRQDQLLVGMQLVGVVGLLSVWGLRVFQPDQFSMLPYIVFCGIEAFLRFLLIHFWNYTNHVFDPWEGKRLFPFIGGAGLMGTIVGGIGTNRVASQFGATTLFIVWAILLLLAIPLAWHIRKVAQASGRLKDESEHLTDASPDNVGVKALKLIWRQPLIRTLTFMTFPLWIIIYVIEFNYFDTMNRVFINQDELAGFLGLFVSLCSLVGLILQFSTTPWLLRRLGVGPTSMLYMFSLTVGSISLLIYSLFPSAIAGQMELVGIALFVVFARFCDIAIYYSVYDSSSQLLYYAVPDEWRGKGSTFINGIIIPISTAAAGGLLILFRGLEEPVYNVTFMAVTLGFLLIVLGLNLTPDYLTALLANINPHDSKRRNEVLEEIAKLDQNEARYVLLESVTAAEEEEARFAVEKLFEIKDEELIPDLEEVADKIRPVILKEILSRMTDEEQTLHSGFIQQIQNYLYKTGQSMIEERNRPHPHLRGIRCNRLTGSTLDKRRIRPWQ